MVEKRPLVQAPYSMFEHYHLTRLRDQTGLARNALIRNALFLWQHWQEVDLTTTQEKLLSELKENVAQTPGTTSVQTQVPEWLKEYLDEREEPLYEIARWAIQLLIHLEMQTEGLRPYVLPIVFADGERIDWAIT